jgi:hypothetical protein
MGATGCYHSDCLRQSQLMLPTSSRLEALLSRRMPTTSCRGDKKRKDGILLLSGGMLLSDWAVMHRSRPYPSV